MPDLNTRPDDTAQTDQLASLSGHWGQSPKHAEVMLHFYTLHDLIPIRPLILGQTFAFTNETELFDRKELPIAGPQ
jgi:hypothetical protein